ncbi:unnamed protein product, partial [Ectocarpus fasciculatus]
MATDTTTTTTDTTAETTTTTTTAAVDATQVLSDFSEVVATLKASHEADMTTAALSSVMGKLKIMANAVAALDASPTLNSMQLDSDMAELALLCLPPDTKDVLLRTGCSSDLALELVRRNLTKLPALAKTLYQAKPEELAADKDLNTLHSQLACPLELYGALVARGVNPDRRPWAKKLLAKFSSLTELRWLSWRRLMKILDMGVILGLEEQPAADHPEHEEDDNSADEEEPDAASEGKGAADDGAEEKKSKKGKTPVTLAEAAAAGGVT